VITVTKIKQNATSQATVDLWGGKIRIAFEQDTDIITLRISARNAAAYANQHETGREVFKDHRDIHLLDALPSNLFEKGSGGDRARGAHGVVTLDYSDLPNSGGKHGLIGYAVYLGTTLFLFVMDSAAKGNLPPWPGDPAKSWARRSISTKRAAVTSLCALRSGVASIVTSSLALGYVMSSARVPAWSCGTRTSLSVSTSRRTL
jgi:hypothetical protein